MDGLIDPASAPSSEEAFRTQGRCASIASIDCNLVDPSNPYGPLEAATITLKGLVVDITIVPTDENELGSWPYDLLYPMPIRVGSQKAGIEMLLDDNSFYDRDSFNEAPGDLPLSLFFVSVYAHPHHDGLVGEGLVLKLRTKENSDQVRFVRFGVMRKSVLDDTVLKALTERVVTIE